MAIHRNRSFRSTAVVTVFLAACGAPIIMKAAGHRQPMALSTALKALSPVTGGYLPIPVAHGAKIIAIPLAKGPLRVRPIITDQRSVEVAPDRHPR
jgi:hypothetical protein